MHDHLDGCAFQLGSVPDLCNSRESRQHNVGLPAHSGPACRENLPAGLVMFGPDVTSVDLRPKRRRRFRLRKRRHSRLLSNQRKDYPRLRPDGWPFPRRVQRQSGIHPLGITEAEKRSRKGLEVSGPRILYRSKSPLENAAQKPEMQGRRTLR